MCFVRQSNNFVVSCVCSNQCFVQQKPEQHNATNPDIHIRFVQQIFIHYLSEQTEVNKFVQPIFVHGSVQQIPRAYLFNKICSQFCSTKRWTNKVTNPRPDSGVEPYVSVHCYGRGQQLSKSTHCALGSSSSIIIKDVTAGDRSDADKGTFRIHLDLLDWPKWPVCQTGKANIPTDPG